MVRRATERKEMLPNASHSYYHAEEKDMEKAVILN
jgi:hypothetical protein